jgi:hypothetical protein
MNTRNISWGVKVAGAKCCQPYHLTRRLSWKPQALSRLVIGLLFYIEIKTRKQSEKQTTRQKISTQHLPLPVISLTGMGTRSALCSVDIKLFLLLSDVYVLS